MNRDQGETCPELSRRDFLGQATAASTAGLSLSGPQRQTVARETPAGRRPKVAALFTVFRV